MLSASLFLNTLPCLWQSTWHQYLPGLTTHSSTTCWATKDPAADPAWARCPLIPTTWAVADQKTYLPSHDSEGTGPEGKKREGFWQKSSQCLLWMGYLSPSKFMLKCNSPAPKYSKAGKTQSSWTGLVLLRRAICLLFFLLLREDTVTRCLLKGMEPY